MLKNSREKKLFLELNSDYRQAIFLAGTGRSGTTWVSSIINYNNDYRDIFEPFHPYKVELVEHFRYRQYLRPDNQHQEFLQPTKAILSGKIKNRWTDQFNKKVFCQKRMIKDIRANFLLKWLHRNFPEVPIILLFRHPCAVVNSKLHLGWGNHLDELLAQPELVEDFLQPFKQEIIAAKTDFEKQIFLWCLENYVPLKQFAPQEIHLAFYENFCKEPKAEIERLFTFLGKKFDDTVFAILNKPSATSRQESAIITTGNVVDSWKKYITDEQLERAIEILSLFGLDTLYSQDPLPNISGAYTLMKN
ncbi:sulfotransferase domain-containing protein [Gloeocapsopsis crepidinum LEGE 06123]|uniref:Sulfotransferase domain-containing protein n=1 Tax=Gloeocapsopsis crepidinum LEGE 06123 TaxID=588587 RepID=A0ABR9UMP2_9CHRO|nr:sulfotransferase domain-containing protein [Gloeocapsopsis crepidinum]MBE9189524.1 sulfotransferase domain-containing protein [Gloeocapsopsis crepidinum LEGE 06123]